jgi:hypothetical protein
VLEVGRKEVEADIGRAGGVVGDEVAGFGGDAVAGLNPQAKVGAEDMDSVTNVGTAESRLVGLMAAEE